MPVIGVQWFEEPAPELPLEARKLDPRLLPGGFRLPVDVEDAPDVRMVDAVGSRVRGRALIASKLGLIKEFLVPRSEANTTMPSTTPGDASPVTLLRPASDVRPGVRPYGGWVTIASRRRTRVRVERSVHVSKGGPPDATPKPGLADDHLRHAHDRGRVFPSSASAFSQSPSASPASACAIRSS